MMMWVTKIMALSYEDVDDNVVNNNVGNDEGHLVRNGGDEGVGSVTASKMEIATVHKVQPGNSLSWLSSLSSS